jgi:hypothetical protein
MQVAVQNCHLYTQVFVSNFLGKLFAKHLRVNFSAEKDFDKLATC